ncbi:MAG: type II toxin-antitoxin system HicA family toxin [Planctomycetia bacterium]|nr:type II toxin-antitoxin system HicA family toxin [Planctomycetia bacterium]
MCSILARQGLVEVRQRGSHVVMQLALPDSGMRSPVRSIYQDRSKSCCSKSSRVS